MRSRVCSTPLPIRQAPRATIQKSLALALALLRLQAEVTSLDTHQLTWILRAFGTAFIPFLLKIMYFDLATPPRPSDHAVRQRPLNRALFIFLHFPLVASLPLAAAGLVQLFLEEHLR